MCNVWIDNTVILNASLHFKTFIIKKRADQNKVIMAKIINMIFVETS